MPLTYGEFEAELSKLTWFSPDVNKEAWQRWYDQRVALSQQVLIYTMQGVDYPRIRRGDERRMQREAEKCPDCWVKRGMLHIPGCDDEECPNCHGQVVSCDCWGYEDDDEEDEEDED